MQTSVVILAAGQGKRMNSDLPKVLQPMAGRSLLAHVVGVARELKPGNIFVVYGHGGAQVQAALPACGCRLDSASRATRHPGMP
jgi:bifunctional UDP-N-acetylglucosamine pyrophosphorylase/glucosamine-1-phosphate N-acetyltransferase